MQKHKDPLGRVFLGWAGVLSFLAVAAGIEHRPDVLHICFGLAGILAIVGLLLGVDHR